MTITISAITHGFAAEVGDVELAQPLSPSEVEEIKQAFWQYGVLVFPEQRLTEEQQLAFAQHIGPLESNILLLNKEARLRLTPDIIDISNLTANNSIWGEQSRTRQFQLGNRLWHTDSSFKYLPARASMLYAVTIAPIGGHTEFADLRAAYDALPEEKQRRLTGLVAEHALAYSRAKTGFTNFTEAERTNLPPVPQVVVRTIPETGRKSLYIASHVGRILGMPEEESRTLIDELLAHATQRQFVYTHRWRVHDLVMWDNRCTMHRGTDFDDLRWVRDMHRATVADIANTCEQEGIAIPSAAVPAHF
ncbi:MAG: TauD/TfdA family dioxygenase [Deltaproteobacteria bacterium]|nr:TauD/TfdA family dioxygenase [Deltaproteobacteria bacterium]